MTKVSATLTSRLRELLAQTGGAPREEQIRNLVDETGASGADLRRALDELVGGYGVGAGQEGAWRRVIADFAFSMSNPTGLRGKRAHELLGQQAARKQPWYAAVAKDGNQGGSSLGPLVFTSAPADVNVHGERISSTELAAILKTLAAS